MKTLCIGCLALLILGLFTAATMLPIVTTLPTAESSVFFSPLQKIINNAAKGTTVQIKSGIYHGLLKINKSLTLKGEDAVIDADGQQVGIIISAPDVTLKGFKVQNVIRIGLTTFYSNGTVVGEIPPELSELWLSPEMEGAGIYVYMSSNTIISNVTITKCYDGIGITHSNITSITNSTVSRTTWGLMIHRSNRVQIYNSTIADNADLPNNTGGGICLWSYSSANIRYTTLVNNLRAISVSPYTYYYEVNYNNFINNTHQVEIHPDAVITGSWDHNYWSDYTGLDLNNDEIGDTPYVIQGDICDHYPLMKDPALTPQESNGGAGSNRLPMPA